MLKTIVIFLIILSILVIIHELAHFLVAIWNKVWVKEFGLGFPPRIKKLFRWKNTDFSLNAIPIGGYVSLAGEVEDTEQSGDNSSTEKIPDSALFYNKKAWQRASVIGAGPISNIVFGALLFAIVFFVIGIPTKIENGVGIAYVQPGTPAEQAGLQVGDILRGFPSSSEAMTWLGEQRGQNVTLNIDRPCLEATCESDYLSQELTVGVRSVEETPAGEGALGVSFDEYQYDFYPWYQQIFLGIIRGFEQSFEMIVLILDSLGQMIGRLFVPKESSPDLDVVGPVGMVNQIQQQRLFDGGILVILQFAAILSVNLGIMNLLPFPALDGGKLVMIAVGKLVGREKIAKLEANLDMIGFTVLILLMIIVTTRDIWMILVK